MKNLTLLKFAKFVLWKYKFNYTFCIILFFFSIISRVPRASAQTVLFDFENAPIHTSLPIVLTVSGITAHFSSTGDGLSIQNYFGNNFVPVGFSGNFICPNSINASDLLIKFEQTLTDFSISYSPEEYGCDTSAKMRVTAYMKSNIIGTNTMIAKNPGTWPVDTLQCLFSQGFDSVVVHYDSHPSTGCTDWGPIFAADNMRVIPLNINEILNQSLIIKKSICPNPVKESTTISIFLSQSDQINISIYDFSGRLIINLFNGFLINGEHQFNWNTNNDGIQNGVYFLHINGKNYSQSYKLIVIH